VSDFSLQQSQQADGSWLVTLKPPSWGMPLQPGAAARSYVQGVIPAAGQLSSLDSALVLLNGDVLDAVQPAPQDPITGGFGTTVPVLLPSVDVVVGSSDTRLQARSEQAEQFRLGYAWGRQLTIEGFDSARDRLDLRGFWAEGQQARVVGSVDGVRVELPFNQQSVLLRGVALDQWTPQNLEIWA